MLAALAAWRIGLRPSGQPPFDHLIFPKAVTVEAYCSSPNQVEFDDLSPTSAWRDCPPAFLWEFDLRDLAGFCQRLPAAGQAGKVARFAPRTTPAAQLLADLSTKF